MSLLYRVLVQQNKPFDFPNLSFQSFIDQMIKSWVKKTIAW